MPNDISELDVKRAIFRECAGAAEALARAFRGADAALPSLSRDAAIMVERQLIELARRTTRIVNAVGIVGVREPGDEKTPPAVKFVQPLPEGKYFKPSEMACRDGAPYPEAWATRLAVLFQALDTIREAYGGPLIIVSGYRTPEHNGSISGAKQSQHVQGRAVDLRPFKRNLSIGDINRLHQVINDLLDEGKLPAVGGVGVYPLTRDRRTKLLFPGWVHVDTRPRAADGHIARWSGEDFGAEQVT